MSDVAEIDEAELPKGWVMSQLADLAINPKNDIVDGPFGSNLKASEYIEAGAPIVRLQNIKRNNFLDKNIKCVSFEKAEQLSRHSFKPGDLLITKLGAPLGVACIAPHAFSEGIIVADLVRARLPEEKVDTKYITYLINSPSVIQQFKENTKGTTRPRVNLKFMRNLRLPIAPLDQQKQIVAKIEQLFSHIDAGIDALNTAKQRLKQYRQSVLKAAVTGELTKEWREANKDKLEPASQLLERILQTRRQKWEELQLEQFKAKGNTPKNDKWKEKYKEPESLANIPNIKLPKEWFWVTIGQVFDVYVGATPSRKKTEYWGGEINWVSSGEVAFCQIKETKEKITINGLNNSSTTVHPVGTVMLGMIGEGKTRGQSAILAIPAAHNQNTAAIEKLVNAQSTEYLYFYLMQQYEYTRKRGSGNNQKALNKTRVQAIEFPLPPLKEQQEIANLVGEKFGLISRLESEIETQLLKAQKTKQSILASAFSGKLI